MTVDTLVSRSREPATSPSRARALALLGSAYLAYAALQRRLPAVPVCAFRALTGRRCPLCGLTHGVNRTLARDFEAARDAHPCAVPVTLLLVAGSATLLTPPVGARPS